MSSKISEELQIEIHMYIHLYTVIIEGLAYRKTLQNHLVPISML